jgi:hypothetical protein
VLYLSNLKAQTLDVDERRRFLPPHPIAIAIAIAIEDSTLRPRCARGNGVSLELDSRSFIRSFVGHSARAARALRGLILKSYVRNGMY